MVDATLDHLRNEPGVPPGVPNLDAVDMRQLRHHTKNALQRIIVEVSRAELRATPAGAALADEIERRICLSARISDALFGLTIAPGPLDMRLMALCNATVALFAHPKQVISVDVAVAGECPPALEPLVVQVAHEMVGNAAKHGMHMRATGRITLRLTVTAADEPELALQVSDNGWGPRPGTGNDGDGLAIMRLLAAPHGGVVSLTRDAGLTIARLDIAGGRPS